jgi:hypothetical protein
MSHAIRRANVKVFPVPAAPLIFKTPCVVVAARCWAAFNCFKIRSSLLLD